MDEQTLMDKMRLIEALFAGAGTEGERDAAANALERMRERLAKTQELDPPVEYRFSMPDMWSRRLFVALLRRYGLKPYRYKRQRYTSVMVQVSKRFVDETLWPEFKELNQVLRTFLEESTTRVIRNTIWEDSSEAEVRPELPG